MKIIVKDEEEAFKIAGEMFPTDYELDSVASLNAGYDIYRHSTLNQNAWISDLGSRLEVNIDGKTTNIWINEPVDESVKQAETGVMYMAVTLKSRRNESGEKIIWKDVAVDTDRSFTSLQGRHYKRYGINYESMYIIDANGETVYSHAGIEE